MDAATSEVLPADVGNAGSPVAAVPEAPSFPPPDSAGNRSADANRGKLQDLTLDALKVAIAKPGEHRLFRSGKLPGLFPTRTGASADAALAALSRGLLETVRTETRGKVVTEWVRVTPAGVGYVQETDSPRAVLRELRDVIGATRAGVPAWMDEARREIAATSERFESRAAEFLQRLDLLTERVESALRRAEAAGPGLSETVRTVVPWGPDALSHLDARMRTDCPLAELFAAIRGKFPDLTVPEFHDGLRRLHDVRALQLVSSSSGDGGLPDPEFAMIVGVEVCNSARR